MKSSHHHPPRPRRSCLLLCLLLFTHGFMAAAAFTSTGTETQSFSAGRAVTRVLVKKPVVGSRHGNATATGVALASENHHQHLRVGEATAAPRTPRLLAYPDGTYVMMLFKLAIPIPFCQAPDSPCTTFDIDIPFTYNLPNSTLGLVYSGRKLEEDHAAVFEMAEDLLNKFGLNGKACILKLICELAESRGLPFNGLLGRAFETIFLLDYGMSSTERLYEYISARTYGEHQGNCAAAYPQCPFSVFSLMGDLEENVYGTSNNIP